MSPRCPEIMLLGFRFFNMCGMDVADTSGMDVSSLRLDCLPRLLCNLRSSAWRHG